MAASYYDQMEQAAETYGLPYNSEYCDYCEREGHTFTACPSRDDEYADDEYADDE